MPTTGMVDAALGYAQIGWRVFPVHSIQNGGKCTCGNPDCGSPGKHPRTEHGVKDATRNEQTIRQWWYDMPDSNVAVACGDGLMVLDIDGEQGLERVKGEHMPLTPTVRTGNGEHRYFVEPFPVKNAARFADELDIRGEGGYVVAPPSLHYTGQRYEWAEMMSPQDVEPADCPEWLAEILPRQDMQQPMDGDALATVVPEGSRNQFLARYAGILRHKGASEREIRRTLRAANEDRCKPPLPQDEVDGVARSIAKKPIGGDIGEQVLDEDAQWKSRMAAIGEEPAAETTEPDAEQEQRVLGSMIADEAACRWCLDKLDERDFARLEHRELFGAIGRAKGNGSVVDPTRVLNALQAYETTITRQYIDELLQQPVDAQDIQPHAQDLRERRTARDIAQVQKDIGEELHNGADEAMNYLLETTRRISEHRRLDAKADNVADIAMDVLEEIEQDRAADGGVQGARFGIDELDVPLGGLREQRLVLLKGQSGFGKTTLAGQAAFETAVQSIGDDGLGQVLVYMLEDSRKAFLRRFLSWESQVSEKCLRTGGGGRTDAGQQERIQKAYETLMQLPMRIADDIRYIEDIEADVRTAAMAQPVEFVLIDYAQLIQGGEGANKTQQLEDVATRLTNLAGEVDAPILVPSQVTIREGRHYEKHCTALKDNAYLSLEIERGAAGDSMHEKQESNKLVILCDKSRNDEPLGMVECRANFACRRIYGMADWGRQQAAPKQAPQSEPDEEPDKPAHKMLMKDEDPFDDQ